MTTNRKWRSAVCEEQAKPQKDNQKNELEFETSTCPLAHESKGWQNSCSSVPEWDETKVS